MTAITGQSDLYDHVFHIFGQSVGFCDSLSLENIYIGRY